jgi:hypothetical protein
MGVLTDDMTRLRGEIDALRGAREALCEGLMQGARNLRSAVWGMRADFRKTRADMASRTGAEREATVKGVRRAAGEVRSAAAEMQANFRNVRAEMARQTGKQRSEFVGHLSQSVSDMTTGFHDALSRMSRDVKSTASASLNATRDAVSALKRTVAEFRQDFGGDLSGARQVFFGRPPVEKKPEAQAKAQKSEAASPAKRRESPRAPSRKGKSRKSPEKSD